MPGKERITVDDAYSVETPADNRRLYERWADTYDDDFVSEQGYVYHHRVAEYFVQRYGFPSGPVLDVGCGTGVVGAALRNAGVAVVHGVDISPQMLAQSRRKRTADGDAVYEELFEADLTQRLEMADGSYAGLVSAGTFTHGHLGPDALGMLWRLARPGAACVIGINSSHFESRGFADRLDADVSAGRISVPEQMIVDIYAADTAPGNNQAILVGCTIR